MDEMKKSYFYHGGLTECEWISLTTFLLCFGLHPYDAIMNTVGKRGKIFHVFCICIQIFMYCWSMKFPNIKELQAAYLIDSSY